MPVPFIDLKAQYLSIRESVDKAIRNVILEGEFIKGKYVQAFEEEFAAYCGARHCIGVGNGTDALIIAMKALGIGPGDEVITAANSFIATSEAVTAAGAKAVFADVDPGTFNISVEDARRRITPRTKAVIPVHLYGQPADMDETCALAREAGIHVIEDAAQAHGARYKGKRTGTLGHAAAFSFYPEKILGAYGDAGAVVTDDAALAERCRMLADHGRAEKHSHKMEGTNSRLDGLQAAVLSVKLRHLDAWFKARHTVASYYAENLELDDVQTPRVMPGTEHAWHVYCVKAARRDALAEALRSRGIGTAVHYPVPLPLQEAYRYLGHRPGDFPVTESLSPVILSLPIYSELSRDSQDQVIEAVREFYGE